ncbi:hypothetical protein KDN24_06895 [Bacillus sp. Bva_UNVM-123]|uniref:hypothetical protein n=1 Tax=Bacillus sp. Bva_UNVM-123 TaxID=2829798 RepID=UPI00391F6C40
MNQCEACKHWKYTCYSMGECAKIKEKLTIDLVTGWDGGYVNVIETDADFCCNQFEKRDK